MKNVSTEDMAFLSFWLRFRSSQKNILIFLWLFPYKMKDRLELSYFQSKRKKWNKNKQTRKEKKSSRLFQSIIQK